MNQSAYTWIEISRQALEHNICAYKKIIGDDVMLGIVVKSNAYGHGIREIASLCEQSPHVDWLLTTALSEALLLRTCGIQKPILVMCLLDDDPAQALIHTIDVMAYDVQTITMLNEIGKKLQIPARIHIKIDTGMSRFGLYQEDALKTISFALQQPYIDLRGIYTHFAESDHEDQEFTLKQLTQFNQLLAVLEKMGIDIPIKHAGNSAAAAILTHGRYNLVRVGAGAYGMWPSESVRIKAQEIMPDFDLKQVMSWKTRILNARSIPAQQYIGYSRTHQTQSQTPMGLLPIGYFDGYDRRLSNKGTFVVTHDNNHYYAPVVGRVCMNVTMIDLSSMPSIAPGTTVTIIGDHEQIKPVDIAHTMGSFNPREVTTRINPAIQRIIVP